jgi:hypothetical protein
MARQAAQTYKNLRRSMCVRMQPVKLSYAGTPPNFARTTDATFESFIDLKGLGIVKCHFWRWNLQDAPI